MAQLKSTVVQGALTVTGNAVANKFIKMGGTENQILMANGSVKGIGDLITIPDISITDTTDTTAKPIVGHITAEGQTITVSRIGLDDLGLASAYKYQGSVAKYENLPTSDQKVGDVWNVTETGMNYAWNDTAWDALGSTIDTSGFVSATKNASVSVAGTTKDTYTYNKTTIFSPNGLIMGGTAAAAGLVTRGICGVSTPNETTGACSKDHLYLNYDGNNTWNAATRAIIINAGALGTDLGSGMYQYAAVRGDIVKAWVEAKKYLTAETDTLQTVTTRGATTNKAITTAGLTTTSTLYVTGTTGHREGIRITPYGELSSIWWNATGAQDYTTGQMWGITAYTPSYAGGDAKKNTFRFRGPTASTDTSATDQMWINTSGLVTARGGFEHGGLTAPTGKTKNDYILLAGGGTKAVSDFATSGSLGSYLPITGGTLTGTLGFKSTYLIKPVADYICNTSSISGAITINLPTSIGNTMISLWIDVYNYVEDTSFSVHVGGYTYNNSTWEHRPSVMVYGANHKVRLGHNGTNFVIYIGELNSSWAYPQISVRNVLLGYGGTYNSWYKDWTINFTTDSFKGTNVIEKSDKVWTTKNDGTGSGLDADLLDGQDSSYYLDYDHFIHTPTIPTVNNGTLTMGTSGTGVSGSATFTANQSTASTFTVTLDSSAAGNRGANKVVLAKAAGQIDSDKFTVTSAGTAGVTMEYDSSYKALKFVFA